MALHYDPLIPPDGKQWLATDETAKIRAVMQYHKRAHVEMPNERLHAVAHVTVENQAAMDDTPVPEALDRLMGEGLDRHEAIHAVASVLMGYIWQVLSDKKVPGEDPNAVYFAAVRALTAEKWRKEYGGEEE